MIFVIDIGNSSIVLGLFREDRLIFSSRISTDKNRTEDEYAVIIQGIFSLHKIDPAQVEGIIISSVVPPLSAAVGNAAEKMCSATPMFVGPGIKTAFKIRIDNPAQLGSDMVANVAGALTQYKPPLLIVDLGTATTMTAVDKNGDVLGGTIAPGVRLSLNALSSSTAQLPAISLEDTRMVIGRNTVDSMKAGVVLGAAAMIDGMIDNFAREMGTMPFVVATGGMASIVIPHCRHTIQDNPHLLLEGLLALYRRNTRMSL